MLELYRIYVAIYARREQKETNKEEKGIESLSMETKKVRRWIGETLRFVERGRGRGKGVCSAASRRVRSEASDDSTKES